MPTKAQRVATMAVVRAVFNANADAMKAAKAAIVADGGADLTPLVLAYNPVAIALNDLAPEIIRQIAAANALPDPPVVPPVVVPPVIPPVVVPPADLASTVAKDSDLRTHPDVLQYVEFSSNAQVLADLGASNWNDPSRRAWFQPSTVAPGYQGAGSTFLCDQPEYIVERGFPMLRCNGNRRLINAWLWVGKNVRHAFNRFVFTIESDVAAGFTESGLKLSGFCADNKQIVSPPLNGTEFYWIAWHGTPTGNAPDHPPYGRADYMHDDTTAQNIGWYGGSFPVGEPIVVEQELDMDGGENNGKMWVNDVLVSTRTIKASGDIQFMAVQFYHGGMQFTTAPIHYRIGGVCIAKKRIGPPMELRTVKPSLPPATVPTSWRDGLKVGVPVELPNSSPSMLGGNPNKVNAWSGMVIVPGKILIGPGCGHMDGNDNGVDGCDLATLKWSVFCPPSAEADRWTSAEAGQGASGELIAYNRDGKPAARHNYCTLQYSAPLKRILIPFSSALWYASQGANHMDGLSLDGVWDPKGTWPDCPLNALQALCCTSPDGDIYVADDKGRWVRFDARNKTWGTPQDGLYGYVGGVIDAKRNRIVRAGASWDSLAQVQYFDLGKNAKGSLVTGLETPAGTGAAITISDDVYYICRADGKVYGVDPDIVTVTLKWHLPPATNGVWNRFAYSEEAGGIFYLPEYAANMWFIPMR